MLWTIPMMVGVATITFLLMHYVPGGPWDQEKKLPPQVVEDLDSHYGLDQPMWRQYWGFLTDAVRGDLGGSYTYQDRSVTEILRQGLPASATLGGSAVLIAVGVGVLAQVIVLAVAIPIGSAAGYAGARLDDMVMRGVDIVYAFPDLLLIILLRAILGSGVFMLVLAIGLASWPTIARLVRAQTISLAEREFVLAARATGAGGTRIVVRHLLPNALGPVIVAVAFLVPNAIFAKAALSYIGIGASPPTASWGSMVQDGYGVMFVAYGPVLFPVAVIALAMLAFSLLSDGLRDIMDPRTSSR